MTDAELDRIYETACAEDWEEQNREDPKREALSEAAHKAIELLKEAWDTLGGAVDEDSRYFDSVVSYCNDLEDMIDNLNSERWVKG